MTGRTRRVVTGHDAAGKSIVVSDGMPPQDHPMRGAEIGAVAAQKSPEKGLLTREAPQSTIQRELPGAY